MDGQEVLEQTFEIIGRNYARGGKASTKIKEVLKEIGIDSGVIRRAAIAAYEAEMNIVMYAQKGWITLLVTPASIQMKVTDQGSGIADIELAMQEGYTTAEPWVRELGFGAGMGLPNIKKCSDTMDLQSVVGEGTTLKIEIMTGVNNEGKRINPEAKS